MKTTTICNLPSLQRIGASTQLLVNGRPFLMLGGELQNSALSSSEYMDTVWSKLAASNFNTVLGSVSWEQIEPKEGEFDFAELDRVILGARKHNLRLILLWFGSYKNGVSTYAPAWVKTNPVRFPRAKFRQPDGGLKTADVLSPFCPESWTADARAFRALMAHLKEVDEDHFTVLMVQVENEVGLRGESRDRSVTANSKFSGPVPADIVSFLAEDWENLHVDLKNNLSTFKTSGSLKDNASWEELFGQSLQTDELFMAYHYAQYLQHVAAAGKEVYPLPMFTNVWMSYTSDNADENFPFIVAGGANPGEYPSGGGVTTVLDIWQKFAPSLDFIAPDIYFNDYSSTCAKYRHRGQPLFIPEQRRDDYGARRVWIAYGSHAALCASPFGIDTLEPEANPFTKHYRLLRSVAQIVLTAQQRADASVGFCFDEIPQSGKDSATPIVKTFGDYEITIERCVVFGKPDPAAGMLIHLTGGKFLLIGWGFQVRARAIWPEATFTGILSYEEKVVEDEASGKLRTVKLLNGDETRGGLFAMMPSEDPDYGGFPICVTIPARTMIAQVEFYHITEEAQDKQV